MEMKEKIVKYKNAILDWMKKGVELNLIRKSLEGDPEVTIEEIGDAAYEAMMEFGLDRMSSEPSSTKFFHGGDAS